MVLVVEERKEGPVNWQYLIMLAWHGFAQLVITAGGIAVALGHWPTKYEWLVIIVSGLMAGAKGIEGYLVVPGGGPK